MNTYIYEMFFLYIKLHTGWCILGIYKKKLFWWKRVLVISTHLVEKVIYGKGELIKYTFGGKVYRPGEQNMTMQRTGKHKRHLYTPVYYYIH
jgi:hypothetical protein